MSGREGLIEPEGVDAVPNDPDPDGDVRSGGDPHSSEPDPRADDPLVVIPPWGQSDPDAPSLAQSREEGAP